MVYYMCVLGLVWQSLLMKKSVAINDSLTAISSLPTTKLANTRFINAPFAGNGILKYEPYHQENTCNFE